MTENIDKCRYGLCQEGSRLVRGKRGRIVPLDDGRTTASLHARILGGRLG